MSCTDMFATFLGPSLQFRDAAGKEIGSKKCYIIGSDGGIVPNADKHTLPAAGLLTDVAYRWDIICDFTGYTADVSTLLHVCKSNQSCTLAHFKVRYHFCKLGNGLTVVLPAPADNDLSDECARRG